MDIHEYFQQQAAAAFAGREVQTLRAIAAAAQRIYDDAQDWHAWEALSAALAALKPNATTEEHDADAEL